MKRIIKVTLFLLVAIMLNAQNPFEKSILLEGVFPSTFFTNFVEMVDVDGDGDLDVVGAARDNALVWYENIDGQGSFSSQKLIAGNITKIVGLDVDDLSGDGLVDVLIVSESGDVIIWYRNLGNGMIATDPNYITFNEDEISTATIVDLDADGDNDVVFGFSTPSNFTKSLHWCENTDGAGTFSDPIPVSNHTQQAGDYPLGIGDFDGNGSIDIAVGGGSINIYYNDGNENFEKVWLDFVPPGADNRITVMDYDGDGDPDILNGLDGVELYQNDGGVFGQPLMLYSETTSDLQPGDLDGDGDLDLAVGLEEETSFLWLENQGSANPAVVHNSTANLYFQKRISLGDIDGDGDLDVIGSTARGHIATITNTDGQGTFERTDDVNGQIGWAWDIRTADIDGDGDLDALIADQSGDRVNWYENVNGDGSRLQQHNIINGYDGATTVIDADVDGDGDLDVITFAANDLRLLWFENLDGLGNFSDENLIADDLGSDQFLEAKDMDGNGTVDIIMNFQNGRKVMMFRNLGGAFAEGEEVFDQSHNFNTTLIVDLDQDGDQDIIGASQNFTSWGENLLGTGEFANLQYIRTDLDDAWALHASDVDGDLDLDLIYFIDDAVGWVEHLDGIGDFGEPTEIAELPASGIYYEFSEVRDIDNDGDEDIIFLGLDGIFMYENLGYKSGRWGMTQIIDEGYLNKLHTADFSGDGVNDILTFKTDGSVLSLFTNTLPPQNFITGYINRGDLDSCTATVNPVEGLLVASTDGANVYASYTNRNGQFLNKVPTGNYTTTVTNLPTGFTINPVEQMSEITAQNRKDSLTYCVDNDMLDSIQNNLSVHLFRLTQEARPGFDVFYQLVYRNPGNTTLSDTIRLVFQNEMMDYLTASIDPELITDEVLTWTFDDLAPFESRKINIKFNIKPPPIVSDLDIIRFKAAIGGAVDDVDPVNNCYDFSHYLVNSFDPNDITVFEGPEVRHEDYLRTDTMNYLNYMIRFQNTGTASAVNVRLENAIDPNLDWSTLDVISSSHSYRAEINNQDTLKIYYDGIYLPDSTTDLAGSQGFITYQIRMKDGLNAGTTIFNDAAIYFDFNEPIYTNQVATQLVESVTSTRNLTVTTATIHPNPTAGWADITHAEGVDSYQIYDLRGTLLKTETGSDKIDMRPYKQGVYLIKLMDGSGRLHSLKLLKI